MKNEKQADNRWTVRFGDADNLARTRELVHIGAELEGMPMGRFLRLAVEHFIVARHGASFVESMSKLERLSAAMDDLLKAYKQPIHRHLPQRQSTDLRACSECHHPGRDARGRYARPWRSRQRA